MAKSDDKLKKLVLCIEEAEKNHEELAREWKRAYDVYLGKPEQPKRKRRNDDWRSRLYVKHAFQQVETLLPEFLVDDPNFEVQAREQSDEPRAKTVQKLLNYQLDRDRYAEKRMMAVKKAIIFGACPIKVTWSHDVRRMRVRNPMTAQERAAALLAGEEVKPYVDEEVTLCDDPTMIVVDPFDFMWDPAATSIDDASYVLHRSWLTPSQLRAKQGAGLYQGLDEILDGEDDKSTGSVGSFAAWAKRLTGERDEEAQKRRADRHEVIEKWTPTRLTVIVDRKVVARDIPNPYWHGKIPFVMAVTQPDVDKMVGLSEVWSIEPLQEAIWTTQNAQYDALRMVLDPPIFMDERDPRLKEFEFKPGARGFTSNPGAAVNVIDIGQANAYASGAEVQRMRAEMELVSGINASMSGTSNEGTATEAAMNLRQGKGRIALKVANVDAAFARAAEMMIQLDQQFIDADRVIRIVGDGAEWASVSPQDIAGAYDVRARNSTDSTLKEIAREQSLNLLNTFAQYASMGVNIWPLMDKAALAHDIQPDLLRPAESTAEQPTPMLDGTQPQLDAMMAEGGAQVG